jgi:DNA-binding HxlR family transcriptional regulator
VARSSTARQVNARLRRESPVRPSTAPPASEIATSLDRLLHDRMRLGIVSALAASDDGTLSFTELKAALNATDGNLGGHVRKLEDAGYVVCDKSFQGRSPRTEFRLTAGGRRALEQYLNHLDAIIRATRKG